MQTSTEQKVITAKRVGSLYFVLLGVINLGATLWNAELRALDFIILFLSLLPVLINKEIFLLLFGIIAGLVSLYIGFACFTFHLDPATKTSQIAFMMGYLLAASSLFSSILLTYAGTASQRKLNIA